MPYRLFHLMKIFTLLFCLFSFPIACTNANPLIRLLDPLVRAGEGARYMILIEAHWCHPTLQPACPTAKQHFSRPVGATHNENGFFWKPSTLATEGIKRMAEMGETTTLTRELADIHKQGDIGTVFVAVGGIPTSPATKILEFEVHHNRPMVSVVTMLAPSPDWFTGVHNISLLKGDGSFHDSIVLPIFAYDAGTDSALGFMHTNTPTSPRANVTRMDALTDGNPFQSNASIGQIQFRRLD